MTLFLLSKKVLHWNWHIPASWPSLLLMFSWLTWFMMICETYLCVSWLHERLYIKWSWCSSCSHRSRYIIILQAFDCKGVVLQVNPRASITLFQSTKKPSRFSPSLCTPALLLFLMRCYPFVLFVEKVQSFVRRQCNLKSISCLC